MKTRCDGCGVKIQTNDPNQIGYIRSEVYLKNPDSYYCERCFNLIHYNKKIAVSINEEQFQKNIKKIAATDSLIVYVLDIYDLEGTYIKEINDYFKEKDIILVANKFDLFLDSVKVTRIKNYVQRFTSNNDLRPKSTIIMSSFKNSDISRLINEINKFQKGRDVYFFGMTNVGKSSIVNKILEHLNQKNQKITVSAMPSTTLDLIKIPLPNKTYLYDTPGILNTHQFTYYLTKETLNIISPKKYIKPKVFQLNPEQALFIGGFCVFEFLEGSRSSFVVNVSNSVVIHRTKLSNSKDFYEKHLDDILKLPTEEERTKLGEISSYEFNFTEEEKIDISISGLGFVTIKGNGKVRVKCFEKIKVNLREAII